MTQPTPHYGAEKVVQPRRRSLRCEMNVTPLIDVLLVLLVIFIAALPMTQKDIDVNVPPIADGGRNIRTTPDTHIVLEISADGKLAVNKQEMTLTALGPRLRWIFEQRTDKTLFIIGPGSLRYGAIIDIIDAAKGAGVERVGIVTEGMRREAGKDGPA